MSNIQISVTNKSGYPQQFFLFQQPAMFTGGSAVFSVCSGNSQTADNDNSVFSVAFQIDAAACGLLQPPKVGQAINDTVSTVPVEMYGEGGRANTTRLTVEGGNAVLGSATNSPDVGLGTFRIVSPMFNPAAQQYAAGLAVSVNGLMTLSSFVAVQPSANTDVRPVYKFYIATGSYSRQSVIPFDQTSQTAAVCDATQGMSKFDVVYQADGTWMVRES